MAKARARRKKRLEPPLRRLGMAAQNALELVRAGRLTSPYGAPFDVAHADRTYKLRRYQGEGETAGGPLILVPPLMVASEVYDMAPDVSAVSYLMRQGLDVWVTDFGAPEREEGGLGRTLDDHVRAVSDAVDRVRAATGEKVHLAGYSQGGMFAYQTAALRRAEGLASVITFGSPVDIHRNVPRVSDAVTERLVRGLHALLALPLDRIEGLPGVMTSTGFKLLSARKEVAQAVDFVRKLGDRQALEKREAKRLFLRGDGFVAWPGPALRKFIDEMIVANRMSTGGFVIDGRTLTLADVDCPILAFIGLRDEIARAASVEAIRRAAPRAEVHELGVKAGHFGIVVGSRALSETWPTVAAWCRWRDGRGPIPKALRRSSEPDPSELDEVELALEDFQLDAELAVDVVAKAAETAWNYLGDVARDASESLERLRYQVPRLSRLRSLGPDSRISLGLALAEQAESIPARTFFLWRGRAFSYEIANRRVDNVVRGLIACGVEPGTHVGVLMRGRPSYLTIVAALNRLGAVSVLLASDGDDGALARSLELGEVEVLVVDPEHAERGRRLFSGDVLALGGGGGARPLPGGVTDMEEIDPDAVVVPGWYRPNPGRGADLATIILSAGRDGRPRAARVTNHRWAFSALGAAAVCTLTQNDTVYCCLPLSHAAGALVSTGGALMGGARLALAERFDPAEFWTEVRRYGATVVFYAGEMCRQLVDAPHARGENNHPVRLLAGSGMRPDVWQRLRDRFGPTGVLEFYASTETNAVLANASGEKIGSVGRPMPGSSELALVEYDPDTGEYARDGAGRMIRCGAGRAGVLLARLDSQTLATAPKERTIRDALAEGDAWYVTGDLLRRDEDGDHWFLDRVAHLIPTRDGNVSPRRVEERLYRIPGVRLAICYGVPDEGAEIPVAAVVLAEGVTLDPEAASDRTTDLPDHARPRAIRCLGSIPMTGGFRPLRAPVRAATVEGRLEETASGLILRDGRYRPA